MNININVKKAKIIKHIVISIFHPHDIISGCFYFINDPI